jgi:DNA-binding beta-propeller fold protein YncE
MPIKRILILISCVFATACAAAKPPHETALIAPQGDVLIAANQKSGSVTMIELETGRTVAHLPVGSGPHELAVSPDGRTALVPLFGKSFLRGDGYGKHATVIDIDSAKVVRTIDLGANSSPHGAFFRDDDRTAAVTSADAKAVLLVDTETGNIVHTIPLGNPPYLLTRSRDGRFAYSSNPQTDTVSEIDLETKALTRTFAIAGNPGGIAVSADGKSLWTARTENDALSVVDLASGEIVKTFEGIDVMRRIAVSPDGKTILVTSLALNEVRLYDADAKAEIGKIAFGEGVQPSGAAFGASSEIAYVTSPGANLIIELDIKNQKILRKFATESSPDGIVYIKRAAK